MVHSLFSGIQVVVVHIAASAVTFKSESDYHPFHARRVWDDGE